MIFVNFIRWWMILGWIKAIVGIRTDWLQKSIYHCDTQDPIDDLEAKYLFEQQGLAHCQEKNVDDMPCRSIPFVVHRYNRTDKSHHRRNASIVIDVADHYTSLMRDSEHSIHRINKKVKAWKRIQSPEYIWADITLDFRCFHSWTVNPFHRHSDCLAFILPAYYNYFRSQIAKNSSLLARSTTTEMPLSGKLPKNAIRSPNVDDLSRIRVVMLVDESSDGICKTAVRRSSQKNKVFAVHRILEEVFGDIFTYVCIYTSNYFASPNWFQNKVNVSVISGEYLFLQEQKNPFTHASGYHAPGAGVGSPQHPSYRKYLREYRRILFDGYCTFCHTGELLAAAGISFASTNHHDSVLIISRKQKQSRYIPQMHELVEAVDNKLRQLISRPLTTLQTTRLYHLDQYYGHEPMCEIIGKFWHAKVVIAAHGAGIINMLFARPNTLLIEITADSIDPSKRGEPWRSNSYIAHLMNVSTHVLVVPHHPNATSERDLQMRFPLEINRQHIDFVVSVVEQYLGHTVPLGQDKQQVVEVTSMV